VYEPTPEELAAFKKVQKPVPDRIAKETGAAGVALLKAIRKNM
jgi:hypothetical protein